MDVPLPIDEERRLAALHALALDEVDAAADYQSLVALAADMLDCPLAMLNLVDRDRQWVMARSGEGPDTIPRDHAICDHTIRRDGEFVVDDLAADPRFSANPLIVDGDMRFYAGMPIHVADDAGVRRPIGALCVIDQAPRSLSESGRRTLRHLAGLAEALVAARAAAVRAIGVAALAERQAAVLDRQDRMFRQAERMAMMGSWRLDLADESVHWSDGVASIHGYPPGTQPLLSNALDHYPPADRARVGAALSHCIETGEPFDLEIDFLTVQRTLRRVRTMGEIERVDGQPRAVFGIFQDVTNRHALEVQLRRSAEHDPLTGIANRAAFDRALAGAVARAGTGHPLLLVLIDLDGFKTVNDTLGHLAGDDVLRETAKRLGRPWLAGTMPARLGGDEFALIVDDARLCAAPDALVSRLEEELCRPVTADGGFTIATAGTVGAVAWGPGMVRVRDLFHAADAALYAAKRRRIGERRAA